MYLENYIWHKNKINVRPDPCQSSDRHKQLTLILQTILLTLYSLVAEKIAQVRKWDPVTDVRQTCIKLSGSMNWIINIVQLLFSITSKLEWNQDHWDMNVMPWSNVTFQTDIYLWNHSSYGPCDIFWQFVDNRWFTSSQKLSWVLQELWFHR